MINESVKEGKNAKIIFLSSKFMVKYKIKMKLEELLGRVLIPKPIGNPRKEKKMVIVPIFEFYFKFRT